ncbi:MAG: DUF808 domain-containing protein [Candidatus Adiutrix sp.]|nr:DUF808 domain-containing protein [Candidatus Adiutrix sp.]
MPAFSLLALLDDITAVLDDVALMTKMAAKKTAGVLGDDLALNARQVSGVRSEREWPVVWAVAKGSLVNKALLIPAALVISALAPQLITPLLMLGGSYLCFEGAEKLAHSFLHKTGKTPEAEGEGPAPEPPSPEAERDKIKGAIRTDFILSAEIIVIALGITPADSPLYIRAAVLILIGLLMTVGVYGLVGGIVKLDDLGFWLLDKSHGQGWRHKAGNMLVGAAPVLMRFLAVAGTAAMFLVGGGILAHGLPFLHPLSAAMAAWPPTWFWPLVLNAGVGFAAGSVIVSIIMLMKKFRKG